MGRPAQLDRSRWALRLALGVATVVGSTLGSSASADEDEPDDGRSGRHRLELAVAGGLSVISDRPENVDLTVGGQVSGRAMVDLIHARADAWVLIPDPSRPDYFQLRADGRLLLLVVHDLTWRRSDAGELIRLFAGVGGEVDLPFDVGHLMLSVGFAMVRSGGLGHVDRPFDEAYGGYAGLTVRLHFWELRDELRFAAQAMARPPTLEADSSVEGFFAALVGGVTASNRLYYQALRAGVVSLGPELQTQIAMLPAGPVLLWTLGLSGALAI